VDSLTRKSGQPKGRSSSSPRCTNPVCDGCLSLNNPSQQSVQDDHGLRDLDRTITTSPAKAGSDGLSAGCLMERDGGASGPEIEDLPARSDSHKEETLWHAFSRHCRDKEWDVVDLRISVEGDGSLNCELLWAPTTVSVSTLKGELLERTEELVR